MSGKNIYTGPRDWNNVNSPAHGEYFDTLFVTRMSRRSLLKAGLGLSVASFLGGCKIFRPRADRDQLRVHRR